MAALRHRLCLSAVALMSAAPFVPPATEATLDEPPPLHLESVTFDPDRGRLVVFGGAAYGRDGEIRFNGETWEWNGNQWRVTADSASGPGARLGAAMAYDVRERRVLLFGGVRESASAEPARSLCDLWAYDVSWTRLSDGPCVTGRTGGASIVFDSNGRLLLVEGATQPPHDTEARPLRIWQWTGAGWALVDSTGPRRSALGTVAFDRERSSLVVPVFEGPDAGVWEWKDGAWQVKTPAGPSARSRYALVYDDVRRRIVMIGGRSPERTFLGDAWTWDGTSWRELPLKSDIAPGARASATLLSDPKRRRLLLFGGTADGTVMQELWLFEDATWSRGNAN